MRLVSKPLSLQELGGSLSLLQDRLLSGCLGTWAAKATTNMKAGKTKALPLQLGSVFPLWGPGNRCFSQGWLEREGDAPGRCLLVPGLEQPSSRIPPPAFHWQLNIHVPVCRAVNTCCPGVIIFIFKSIPVWVKTYGYHTVVTRPYALTYSAVLIAKTNHTPKPTGVK